VIRFDICTPARPPTAVREDAIPARQISIRRIPMPIFARTASPFT